MQSRYVQILLHALLFLVPVAYIFGLAGGKATETAAYAKLIDALPPVCQERMGRFDVGRAGD